MPTTTSTNLYVIVTTSKILIDAILFFVIIGLTLYGVFHGEDLSGLKDAIKECNILWLIPAVPLVLFFIAGESIVIWHMLDCYGIYVKERFCFLFSAVGFFLYFFTFWRLLGYE